MSNVFGSIIWLKSVFPETSLARPIIESISQRFAGVLMSRTSPILSMSHNDMPVGRLGSSSRIPA